MYLLIRGDCANPSLNPSKKHRSSPCIFQVVASHQSKVFLHLIIIYMTKLLQSDWLRGVQLFH